MSNFNNRLDALHNYERLLEVELEQGRITGAGHVEALDQFISWVIEETVEVTSVQPKWLGTENLLKRMVDEGELEHEDVDLILDWLEA